MYFDYDGLSLGLLFSFVPSLLISKIFCLVIKFWNCLYVEETLLAWVSNVLIQLILNLWKPKLKTHTQREWFFTENRWFKFIYFINSEIKKGEFAIFFTLNSKFIGINLVEREVHFLLIFMQLCIEELLSRIEKSAVFVLVFFIRLI